MRGTCSSSSSTCRMRARLGAISLDLSLSNLLATTAKGLPLAWNHRAMVQSSAVGLWRASTMSTPRVIREVSANQASMSRPHRSRSALDTLA